MSETTAPPSFLGSPPHAAAWARFARALARRRMIALGSAALVSGLGWLYVALAVTAALGAREAAELGPGMAAFGWLVDPARSGPAWLKALCAAPLSPASAGWPGFAAVAAMWIAMTFAMMLPTAAPMLATYAELAETAARARAPAASPLVLACGYAAVWLGFALAAAVLSLGLVELGLMRSAEAPAQKWTAAMILLGAGLYQFSALKRACLKVCQRPFAFFFAHWTESRRGVFRLGLRQGTHCLGCCWAAMLVMFAAGTMNAVWMAALGAAMAIEKLMPDDRFSRALGLVLIGAAGATIWPMVAAAW